MERQSGSHILTTVGEGKSSENYSNSGLTLPLRLIIATFLLLMMATISVGEARGTTYQDVMDYMSANPAPSDCVNWIEEVSVPEGTGYQIWQRCDGNVRAYSQVFAIEGSPHKVSWPSRTVYHCDGNNSGTLRMNYNAIMFTKRSFDYYDCNGGHYYVEHSWHTLGEVAPCLMQEVDNRGACREKDEPKALFIVDQCTNRLTGLLEPCAQNCKDLVERALMTEPPVEICGDGIDNNCNGQIDEGCSQCVDFDDDGYFAYSISCKEGKDCNDNDPSIYPGTEGCEDCKDIDGDGYFGYDNETCSSGGDCDDNDGDKKPGKGCVCEDKDDDGHNEKSNWCEGGDDCDDDDDTKFPGAYEDCDDKDNDCNGIEDDGCCEGKVELSLSSVRPLEIGGNNKAAVVVSLFKPAPPKGCTVNMSVSPIEGSGWHHDHTEYKRVQGALIPNEINIEPSETLSSVAVYTSSVVSGTERITATIVKNIDNSETTAPADIDIKVPLLVELGESAEGYWQLVGSYGEPGVRSRHTVNHSGTLNTLGRIAAITRDYYIEIGNAIRINDLSLPWGGIFDIYNNWGPDHDWHRIGKSFDVNHAQVGNGDVNEIILNQKASEHGCTRYEVSLIHYECP